jgi:hypothetical protein
MLVPDEPQASGPRADAHLLLEAVAGVRVFAGDARARSVQALIAKSA